MSFENQSTEYRRFTGDEIAEARQTEIAAVAEALGYHPRRVGKYYELEEHDSLRIFPNNTYCRFSSVIDGKPETGSSIDFTMRYGGMEFREAVAWLLNFSGRGYGIDLEPHSDNCLDQSLAGHSGHPDHQSSNLPDTQQERPEFCLPERNDNNRRMYAYLCKTRGIPSNIVHELWKQGLIYESRQHHNVVFVSRDSNGEAKHAFLRGTTGMFKCDVPGSDKLHFCFVIPAKGSRADTVCVYEGAIDAISAKALDYLDRKTGAGEPWRVALGMLSDSPLEYFLSGHPEIRKIFFCLDCDRRGRDAVLGKYGENGEAIQGGLLEKWRAVGYQVEDCAPRIDRKQGKDYNDLLILRMKMQEEPQQNTGALHGWERAEDSPFAEEREQMPQRSRHSVSQTRYGQALAAGGGGEKQRNSGRNRGGMNGKSSEPQRYRNRPDASFGYGYKKQRHRR